ncbi:MAG: hypothetical protein IKW37_01345 [Bacteroidaceae bacterium]|nr:hypothetical protein [Bacteroidaceae bacterium]
MSVKELAEKADYTKQGLYLTAKRPAGNKFSRKRRTELLDTLEEYSNQQMKTDMQKALVACDRRSVAIRELAKLLQIPREGEDVKRKCEDFRCNPVPGQCPTEVCAECHYQRCEFCYHYEECEALTEGIGEEE